MTLPYIVNQMSRPLESTEQTMNASIQSLPTDVLVGQFTDVRIQGNTWINKAGDGVTSPKTVGSLDSAKTYLLINSLGVNVTINTVSTATPVKLTGATSFDFAWASGKIALYELTSTESALTATVLVTRYHYVDSLRSTLPTKTTVTGTTLQSLINATKTPWGAMRRCNLADNGTVLAYYGDINFKEDGTNGQVMVEIPKFYYRSSIYGAQRMWDISDVPKSGYQIHPAFIRNGIIKDKIYISAYEGSIFDVSANAYLLADEQVADFTVGTGDKLCSIAGAKPCSGVTQNLTLPNSRRLAQNRGSGWELQDFLTISAIQMLLFVEYGTFESQNAIGIGITNINDATAGNTLNNAVITGLTSSLGNATGQVPYIYIYPNDSTVTTYPVSYRGIENLWGNIWQWVDGININNNIPYVTDYNFQSDKFDGHYTNLGVTLSNANGWVEDWANIQYGFLPSKTGVNKIGDYYYQSTGARVARLGGAWHDGSVAGVAYWALSSSSGSRFRSIGARALYIP